jgi:2-polyprenyl-3-methyl-5-hydroxy-6-metoxy-1,4-benzoquinol methylase
MMMNMSEDEKHEFPRWEELYQQQEIESLPWFNPELDDDLENALDEIGLQRGSALDLGTGPGTQAMELARRGFTVTATDISEAAIRGDSHKYPKGPDAKRRIRDDRE